MSILLTPAEAAARLHMSERLLRDKKRNGEIRYVAISDRKIAYRPEDCDEYLAARIRVEQPGATRRRKRTRPRRYSGKIIPFSQMVG